MTDQESVMMFIDKPFSLLNKFLISKGFIASRGQRDRTHKMNKVIFKLHKRNEHVKISVWHLWLDPNEYGISMPGYVTDIEYTDLDPKEESNVRNG